MPDDTQPVEPSDPDAPESASLDDLLAELKDDATTAPGPYDAPATEPDLTGTAADGIDEAVVGDGGLDTDEATLEPAPDAGPTSEGQPDAELAEAVGHRLTWIPYAAYLGLWVALAAASAYFLKDATPENPARWMPEYGIIVWSGVGLTALGPLLSIGVWAVARRRMESARRGLFASALMRGALTAVFGVAIWAATIYVLELAAAGVFS